MNMLIKFLSKTTAVNEYSNAGHFDPKSFVNCYTMKISVFTDSRDLAQKLDNQWIAELAALMNQIR